MYNSVRGTFFRATPLQLMYSLITDTLMYLLFITFLGPMDNFATWIYLIFLPGFDFLCLIVSFYNYVKDYLTAQRRKK